ncbi:hypothetical protein [Celeribacter sp. SCSIO 80788]|uniref:hypothetical protein n=1 Tax=Celeribacter sp. SCSIO 80788 TaxID=3117013 RepID=UPI003DA24265
MTNETTRDKVERPRPYEFTPPYQLIKKTVFTEVVFFLESNGHSFASFSVRNFGSEQACIEAAWRHAYETEEDDYDALLAENEALKAAQTSSAMTELQRLGQEYDAAQVACVKPLTWHNFDAYVFWAEAVCGTYHVECYNAIWRAELRFSTVSHIIYEIDDFETAIQACCDDYNERITSTLTMRSEAEVWNDAVEACAYRLDDAMTIDGAQRVILALKRETGQ